MLQGARPLWCWLALRESCLNCIPIVHKRKGRSLSPENSLRWQAEMGSPPTPSKTVQWKGHQILPEATRGARTRRSSQVRIRGRHCPNRWQDPHRKRPNWHEQNRWPTHQGQEKGQEVSTQYSGAAIAEANLACNSIIQDNCFQNFNLYYSPHHLPSIPPTLTSYKPHNPSSLSSLFVPL